jgi:hypothetical protein
VGGHGGPSSLFFLLVVGLLGKLSGKALFWCGKVCILQRWYSGIELMFCDGYGCESLYSGSVYSSEDNGITGH